jgi:hypothetical protein
MIEQSGITVAHNSERLTTTLIDSNHKHAFELDHCGFRLDPDNAELGMFRAYFQGGVTGLLECFGPSSIRCCE